MLVILAISKLPSAVDCFAIELIIAVGSAVGNDQAREHRADNGKWGRSGLVPVPNGPPAPSTRVSHPTPSPASGPAGGCGRGSDGPNRTCNLRNMTPKPYHPEGVPTDTFDQVGGGGNALGKSHWPPSAVTIVPRLAQQVLLNRISTSPLSARISYQSLRGGTSSVVAPISVSGGDPGPLSPPTPSVLSLKSEP